MPMMSRDHLCALWVDPPSLSFFLSLLSYSSSHGNTIGERVVKVQTMQSMSILHFPWTLPFFLSFFSPGFNCCALYSTIGERMVKVPTTQSNVNFAFATRTNILRPTSRSGPCHLLLLQCRVHFSQLRWGQKSRPMCGKVLSCTKKYFISLNICYTTIFSGPFLKIK